MEKGKRTTQTANDERTETFKQAATIHSSVRGAIWPVHSGI